MVRLTENEAFGGDLAQIANLPESAMRIAGLARRLTSVGPERAAGLIEVIIRGAARKEKACRAIYTELVDPADLLTALGTGFCAQLLLAAQPGQTELTLCWMRSPVADDGSHLEDSAVLLDKDLRSSTLGMRRMLARRARGEFLNKLLTDPDAVVIAHLLDNARMTEAAVLKICARKPNHTSVLEQILRARRWSRRVRVRVALARNPYLRATFAMNLLPLLPAHEVGEIANDPTLAPSVLKAARALLEAPANTEDDH